MLIAYLNITTEKKSDELNKTKYFLKAIKGPWSVNTASWPWFCCRRQILSVTHFWICKKWLPSVQFCYSFRCLPWIFIESLLGFQHCTGKDKVSTLLPPGPLKREKTLEEFISRQHRKGSVRHSQHLFLLRWNFLNLDYHYHFKT